MYDTLIRYCTQFVELTQTDKALIMASFQPLTLKRKEFLLSAGSVCNFIAFVKAGVIQHYHVKDGTLFTCDITMPEHFITDYRSFTKRVPSIYNFQVLKNAELLIVSHQNLKSLYSQSSRLETFGRLMAEQVAQRTTEIAMSLAFDKPEERVAKLLTQRPDLFQVVPQHYLANLVGISPESFSRIRARERKKS
jgi:CRP-like cAMP-binding protein